MPRSQQRPRTLGKPPRLWTREVVAQGRFAQGLPQRQVSGETLRAPVLEWGVRWKRAHHWITRPAPDELRTKPCRDRLLRRTQEHSTWARGVADDVWGSRLAPPAQQGGQDHHAPIRRQELTDNQDEPAPKALACSGRLLRQRSPQPEQRLLRFVDGRPVRAMPTALLPWWRQQLSDSGGTGLVLVWENASWPKSQAVRTWRRTHPQQVNQTGVGARSISC